MRVSLVLFALSAFNSVNAAPLEKRATVLSNGQGMKSGKISNSLSWQASGKLIKGGCPGNVKIGNCYQIMLAGSGNLARRNGELESGGDAYDPATSRFPSYFDADEDEYEDIDEEQPLSDSTQEVTALLVKRGGGRQRTELYSQPVATSGSRWTYKWRSYLSPDTKTTGSFFHLFQVISRANGGGPIMTLDAKGGRVMIIDTPRGCNGCKSIPISSFAGRTVQHTLTVKYGNSGSLNYKATDVNGGAQLFGYQSSGRMGADASLKVGLYRELSNGSGPATSFVGDFSFAQL